MEHTKEPWRVGTFVAGVGKYNTESVTPYQIVVQEKNKLPYVIAECNWHYSVKDALANASRIVACVNACAGIPTDKLSDGCVLELGTEQEREIMTVEKQRNDLLAALESVVDEALQDSQGAPGLSSLADAVALIVKVKGVK